MLPLLRQAAKCWQNATMTDAPSQSQDKFIVRLPDGMRDKIKAAAEANNRSMNAEIVVALTSWLVKDRPQVKASNIQDTLFPLEDAIRAAYAAGQEHVAEYEANEQKKREALANFIASHLARQSTLPHRRKP